MLWNTYLLKKLKPFFCNGNCTLQVVWFDISSAKFLLHFALQTITHDFFLVITTVVKEFATHLSNSLTGSNVLHASREDSFHATSVTSLNVERELLTTGPYSHSIFSFGRIGTRKKTKFNLRSYDKSGKIDYWIRLLYAYDFWPSQIAPYTSVLVNCIYWAVDSPKLLTIPDAKHLLLPSHTPWLPKSVGAPALPHRYGQIFLS